MQGGSQVVSNKRKRQNKKRKSKNKKRSKSNVKRRKSSNQEIEWISCVKPSSYWDVPPKDCEDITPLQYKAMLESGLTEENIANPLPVVLPQASEQVVGHGSIAPNTGLNARRLYVGNVPSDTSKSEIKQFFNEQIHNAGLSEGPGNVVKACEMYLPKRFVYVEFRSEIEATRALTLNKKVVLLGHRLSIGRPRYNDQPSCSSTSTSVPNQCPTRSKGYIGNLPFRMTEHQVKTLLEPFGNLCKFNLVMNNKMRNRSKGFGFFEHVDEATTNRVIEALDGYEINGRKIIVQKRSDASQASDDQDTGMANVSNPEQPTEILCLMNIVEPEELIPQANYQRILEDIKRECNKYGVVCSIEIPRPVEWVEPPGCGNIFVEFSSILDCQDAHQALDGSILNKCIAKTSYYDVNKYRRKEFE